MCIITVKGKRKRRRVGRQPAVTFSFATSKSEYMQWCEQFMGLSNSEAFCDTDGMDSAALEVVTPQ